MAGRVMRCVLGVLVALVLAAPAWSQAPDPFLSVPGRPSPAPAAPRPQPAPPRPAATPPAPVAPVNLPPAQAPTPAPPASPAIAAVCDSYWNGSPSMTVTMTNDGGWCPINVRSAAANVSFDFVLDRTPQHGRAEPGPSRYQFRYLPDANFSGTDVFSIRLVASTFGSAYVSVSISVRK